MILEAIYEGHFENTSHGFRPNRSCHTAVSYTHLDVYKRQVRKYIAQRAELLGAIRLPNNTFKGNAGTEVEMCIRDRRNCCESQ